MDREEADAIVTKLKDGARANPWVPSFGLFPPRERYHHLPDGLSLCLTMDILTKEYVKQLARDIGTEPPETLTEGVRFWHLSIARVASDPALLLDGEVALWRRAFFKKEPIIEVPGIITIVRSRHFFWKVE